MQRYMSAFIKPDDLNEFVTARLSSIGVLSRSEGECSLRMLALSQSRMILKILIPEVNHILTCC